MKTLPADLEKAISSFSAALTEHDSYFVLSHHDADGVTSCAITCDLLRSLGKDVEFTCLKQIDSFTAKIVASHSDKTLVLTDFGSGHHHILAEHGIADYYVIDHHKPEGVWEHQINPHDFGIDGGKSVSGAGMAYLVAKSLGRRDMAHLAVVGAVGDMQDSRGRLESINRIILADAVEQGTIACDKDIRMFGRMSRSIPQMLAYSGEPVIPGLSGDQQACSTFIESLGIPLMAGGEYRSYVELSPKEKETLFSALYMRMIDIGTPEYVIHSMFGEVYTLVKEKFKSELADAKEYATVLNACGRQRQPDIAVHVCLGDRGERWDSARKLLEKHRRNLRDGIEYLATAGTESMPNLSWFSAEAQIDESIIGVVAGMAYGAQIIPTGKPILAFAQDRDDPGFYKVSARANWSLVRAGIHLGDAMRECSRAWGGEGGGHNIAAGARVPKDKKEEFLASVDQRFSDQKS